MLKSMNPVPPDALPDTDPGGVWRAIFEELEEAVVLFDRNGCVLASNPAAQALFGLSAAQLHARSLADTRWGFVGEDGAPLDPGRHPARLGFDTGRRAAAVLGLGAEAGGRRWLQVGARPIITQEGRATHVVATFRDVTEQLETQGRLERDARFRAALLEVVTESLAQGLDERFYGRLLEAAARAIPGVQAASLMLRDGGRYRFAAAVGYDLGTLQTIYLLPHELGGGRDLYNPTLVYGFDNRGMADGRRGVMDQVGKASQIRVCMSIPLILGGEPVAYVSLDNFDDRDAFTSEALEMARIFAQQTAALWQRFELEAQTRRLALYDPLTGLPNRNLLYDRLRREVARRPRGEGTLAVMFMDLDGFKEVNDLYGHDVGDALLREVAARLRGVVREGDTLARWGGDEFVLVAELERAEDAAVVAGRLLVALEQPFRVDGQSLRARSSIGVELLHDSPKSVEDLVKHADLALYRAKAAGRGTYRFYTDEMDQQLRRRAELEHDLREALERGDLTLDYQPRFDLATGAVTGVEALARWTHPARGPVPPGEFIPVAEETGLVVPLGEQVLDLAVVQAKRWQAQGTAVCVAVNVSAAQLAAPDFVQGVQRTLLRNALDPRLLELEVTESAAMGCVDDAAAKLGDLRALGVRVALDDFGIGYSSLTHLRRLPLDTLKLDRAFVGDLAGGADGQGTRFVRTIIELGHALGLAVVAEGVETCGQLELLRALGCHEAQGFLLARPSPATACDLRGCVASYAGCTRTVR